MRPVLYLRPDQNQEQAQFFNTLVVIGDILSCCEEEQCLCAGPALSWDFYLLTAVKVLHWRKWKHPSKGETAPYRANFKRKKKSLQSVDSNEVQREHLERLDFKQRGPPLSKSHACCVIFFLLFLPPFSQTLLTRSLFCSTLGGITRHTLRPHDSSSWRHFHSGGSVEIHIQITRTV